MAFPSDLTRTKNWGSEVLTDSDLEGQFDLIINWVMASLNSSTGHTHSGSGNNGPKLSITSALTISSQAQGDIIYASSSSAWARLGAGTSGQFLKTQGAGANPIWADVASAAAQSDQETGSSTTTYVSPGRQQFHASACKGWVNFNGTGTVAISQSYNVSSITDNGTGDYSVNWATSFSSANYCVVATGKRNSSNGGYIAFQASNAVATGSVRILTLDNNGVSAEDHNPVCVAAFGDFS